MSGKRPTYKVSDWRGLYGKGWQREIVRDAFTHPAKYARGLIRQIYAHAAAEGWAQAGAHVVDPFGGVALGALDAMRLGLHWTGVELEPRFAALGWLNITLWNNRYAGHFTTWGSAQILTGDSRNLAALVGAADLCVSSPPYGDGSRQEGNDLHPERMEGTAHAPARYDLAVCSPPFSEPGSQPLGQHQGDRAHYAKTGRKPEAEFSDGNLGGLPMSRFELAVSSPPYEASVNQSDGANDAVARLGRKHAAGVDVARAINRGGPNSVLNQPQGYGTTAGNVGAAAGNDFWTAARVIVEQTYAVLAPGGHACWVVKDFVRNKKRVEFSDQWRQLCEAVGFRTLHLYRAWVVEHRGTQYGLDGEHVTTTVERKSFFRRLTEKKGSPRIDWEVVLCMEKPA